MTDRQAPPNPFYRNQPPPPSTQQPISSPPSYSRPVPPVPSGPVSYGSLSDLTRGKSAVPAGGAGGYTYTPDPSRQGYRNDYTSGTSTSGVGIEGGRRMPPPPGNYGVGVPPEPPRRNVGIGRTDTATPPPGSSTGAATGAGSAPTFSSRFASAQNTAAGYIPNSVSATATSLGDRVKGGYDSLTTQQRREQVTAGAGKVAAGAAKLAGKAAWQLGKFASGSK